MRIKAWLKLPHFTVDAYFYTDIKLGGQGLRNIRYTVPTKAVKPGEDINENDRSIFLLSASIF